MEQIKKLKRQRKKPDFEFNCARVFLTYPRCELLPEEVKERLGDRLESYLVCRYIIGRERHADGSHHIHAIYAFGRKLHTTSPKFFDIGDYHCHIKKVDNPERVAMYCRKEGNYIEDWPEEIRGYRSHKADKEQFAADARYKSLLCPFPFVRPDGIEFKLEDLDQKKRHLWFVSDPDWGKTEWVERTFEGKRIYKRVDTKYAYDDYRGEQLIIFDDFEPPLKEVLCVSNRYRTQTPVYGDTRYTKKYWGLGDNRLMIVIHNYEPSYLNAREFQARFTVIELKGKYNPQPQPN